MARTKGQKLAAKRGRPRKEGVPRTPSGQLSRSKKVQDMTAADAMSVVVERRIRHDNIVPLKRDGKLVTPESQAIDPRRGYVLGRLRIAGRITERQHEAGLRFADILARYYALKGFPPPNPQAQNMFAIRGYAADDDEDRGRAARRAEHTAKSLRDMMLGTNPTAKGTKVQIDQGRRILRCIEDVMVHDDDMALGWPDNMVGFLKRGLNIIADALELGGD